MNKKDHIIKAALTLLTRNGVHATPMSAIAKEAGTGMGTIYNYYPSKEVLINEIYTMIKKEETALFANFSETLPIKTQFESYYKATLLFFIEHPLYFNFMEQLHASPLITEASRNVGRKTIAPVLSMLTSGKQYRIIKHIDTEELLQFIGGSIFSFIRWFQTQPKINKKTSLKNQLEMVWDAIKE
ncbi:TetR/AcrR family transcriptional regulator [Ochrovirga pacifica]|uniref:TetR/AcrR family transcriptional regulator n=1 Tax=Ochrovirga pacifica TaxID=1042376 RepID=UPI0002557FA4|nr:TetR/AcrR family transcriptional regulator [Ochrovirga pacifica]